MTRGTLRLRRQLAAFVAIGLLVGGCSKKTGDAASRDGAPEVGNARAGGGGMDGGAADSGTGGEARDGNALEDGGDGGSSRGAGGADVGQDAAAVDRGGERATDVGGDQPSPSDIWTGTWGVSPQASGTTFNQKTIRQILHTSIGGASARVRLSNVFGSHALTIRDVHIANRTGGSSIDAASDVAVMFGGHPSVTIPVGESTTSDAAALAVAPLSDVVVSLFVPEDSGPATSHGMSNQTNYVTDGDVSGNANLSGAATSGSYWFVTNLDVQNPTAEGAVVTLGASITDGVASSSDSNKRWPNDLAARLAAAGRTIGVINQGISGNKLLVDGAGQSALNRFDRDVLEQANVRWVIFSDDPINDLGSGNPPTGDQLIDGLKQLVMRAHAKNVAFLCSTLTPFQGSGGWSPAGETGREAIIAFIHGADSGCDGIVDQDTATHDPSRPTWYLPAYDAGDHLHPNEAGLQAIADAVPIAALRP